MKTIITIASIAASLAPYLLANAGAISLGTGGLFTVAALLLSAVAFEVADRIGA